MKTLTRNTLLLLLLFAAVVVKGQVNLGISSVQGFQKYVHNGQQVQYIVTVHNYGPGPLISGNLLLNTAVDTFVNGFHITKIDSTLINLNLLLPDSEKQYVANVLYSYGPGSNYKKDGNVIVIWPQATGANNIQSYTDTVYIDSVKNGPLNIGEELLIDKNRLMARPNPVKEQVILSVPEGNVSIEQVRIYTLEGKEMLCETRDKKISLKELPQGIYLLKAKLSNGETRSIRVLKE
jgi:hypothetical protein